MLRVIENLMVSSGVEWTSRLDNLSIEPLMPALEAKGCVLGIMDKVIIIDPSSCGGAEPSIGLRVHVLEGLRGVKHSCIISINRLDEFVDLVDGEEGSSEISVQQIDYNSVEWHSDDGIVRECRGGSGDFSPFVKKLLPGIPIGNSFSWPLDEGGVNFILIVLMDPLWNLIKTPLEIHLSNWIFSDVGLESLN